MAQQQFSEQEIPVNDDGWWASVLEEEESRIAEIIEKPQKTDESNPSMPDWERAKDLFLADAIVELVVTGHNRGGLLVEGDGLNGFVPCSHLMDLPHQTDEDRKEDCFAAYLGRSLKVKVIECVPEEGRMVFSERAARTEAGKRPVLFNTLKVGQQLNGEVTNVTEFGVFVDLGGAEGLIHISELSWGRVSHPGQVCKVGQRVDVLVMEVVVERSRIALSLKRLTPNPWETAQQRYEVNSIVPAVVTALVQFGAFAKLEEGLEGLIHASEITLPAGKLIKDVLSTGQNVTVRILQVDASRQRIGLSMKMD